MSEEIVFECYECKKPIPKDDSVFNIALPHVNMTLWNVIEEIKCSCCGTCLKKYKEELKKEREETINE
mgnify:FL=1